MFQNLLVSPLLPPRKIDEINDWENHHFTTVWPELQPHHKQRKEPEIKRKIQKKPKRFRTAFTTEQLRVLKKTFSNSKYIDPESRKKLAESLKIGDKAIKIWFQNQRMKEKRDSDYWDSTESFSESPLSNVEGSTPNIQIDPLELGYNMPAPSSLSYEQSREFYVTNHTTSTGHGCFPEWRNAEYTNNFPTNAQVVNDELQYQCNSVTPSQVPNAFPYDTNVYPTGHYPNGYSREYFEGNTFHPNYGNIYNWADNDFNY